METTNKPQQSLVFINEKSPVLDLICKDLIDFGFDVLLRLERIEDGISQLSTLQSLPEVCIIDLDFYDENVLLHLQKLKAKYPSIKLIAHSDIDSEKVVKLLSGLDVKSYLLIGSDADDFKRAIEKA